MKFYLSPGPLDFFVLYLEGGEALIKSCGGWRDELQSFMAYFPQDNILPFQELCVCLKRLKGNIVTSPDASPVRLDSGDDYLDVISWIESVSAGCKPDCLRLAQFVYRCWEGLRKRQVDKYKELACGKSPLDLFILYSPEAMDVLKATGPVRADILKADDMRKPGPIWAFALAAGIDCTRRLVDPELSPVAWTHSYWDLVKKVSGGDTQALEVLSEKILAHYKVVMHRLQFIRRVDKLDVTIWGEGTIPTRAMLPPYSFQQIRNFSVWAPEVIFKLAEAEKNGLVGGPSQDDVNEEESGRVVEGWISTITPVHIHRCQRYFSRALESIPIEKRMTQSTFRLLVGASVYHSRLPFLRFTSVSLLWSALAAWVGSVRTMDIVKVVESFERERRCLAYSDEIRQDPIIKILSKRGMEITLVSPMEQARQEIKKVPKKVRDLYEVKPPTKTDQVSERVTQSTKKGEGEKRKYSRRTYWAKLCPKTASGSFPTAGKPSKSGSVV